MARTRRAFNGTDAPVVIDPDGTQIDGGSWGKVDVGVDLVIAAVRSGRLTLATEHDDDPDQAIAGQPDAAQLAAAEATLAGDAPPSSTAKTARRAGGS